MTDVETKLRDGLTTFGAETATIASPPAVATIALRARTPEPKHRRWPKLTVVIAGGALVTTGLASAAGVLPGPVESKLREFTEWGFETRGDAELMASLTDGDMRYEVWRAPLEDGNTCIYERAIGPGGDITNGGAVSCGGSGTSWGVTFDRTGPETRETGVLPPGATAARFTFEDGTTFSVAGQKEGFFITNLPGVPYGLRIVAMQAVDADGNVVGNL